MTSNSFSSSAPPSTADGSSRMTSRALRDSALAISTICRCATLRLSSRAPGSTLKPSRAIVSMLLRLAAGQSTRPKRFVGRRPRQRFSATVRCGASIISW